MENTLEFTITDNTIRSAYPEAVSRACAFFGCGYGDILLRWYAEPSRAQTSGERLYAITFMATTLPSRTLNMDFTQTQSWEDPQPGVPTVDLLMTGD